MAFDAHSHPFDLSKLYDGVEAERIKLNLVCVASTLRLEDFLYNESAASVLPMALCFAVHPRLPSQWALHEASGEGARVLKTIHDSLSLLENLTRKNVATRWVGRASIFLTRNSAPRKNCGTNCSGSTLTGQFLYKGRTGTYCR
ncbi:MAG: hypothetical protein LBD44_03395 [Spirochaetaceae bacterium]|jgi:hypothetical protein|nr:hypothetical protein [Spirochaetaceae bacterium]